MKANFMITSQNELNGRFKIICVDLYTKKRSAHRFEANFEANLKCRYYNGRKYRCFEMKGKLETMLFGKNITISKLQASSDFSAKCRIISS